MDWGFTFLHETAPVSGWPGRDWGFTSERQAGGLGRLVGPFGFLIGPQEQRLDYLSVNVLEPLVRTPVRMSRP